MTTYTNRTRSARQRRPITIDQDGREVSASPFETDGIDPEHLFARGAFWHAGFTGTLTREQRIARLEALAQLLEVAFILPGTKIRYGIDGLIGLIPVVGDLLTTAIALWIVREARSLGAPRLLVARMLANVAIDGVVGIVPFVGDAFDVIWRANIRNTRLLRKWIDKHG
jgi:hypothetical protein